MEPGRINPSQIRWRARDQFSLSLSAPPPPCFSREREGRPAPPRAFNEPGCRVLGVSRWFSWRYPTAIWSHGNVLALSPINPSPQDHSPLQICARPSTVAVKTSLRIFFPTPGHRCTGIQPSFLCTSKVCRVFPTNRSYWSIQSKRDLDPFRFSILPSSHFTFSRFFIGRRFIFNFQK